MRNLILKLGFTVIYASTEAVATAQIAHNTPKLRAGAIAELFSFYEGVFVLLSVWLIYKLLRLQPAASKYGSHAPPGEQKNAGSSRHALRLRYGNRRLYMRRRGEMKCPCCICRAVSCGHGL